jgi:GTP-binding protein
LKHIERTNLLLHILDVTYQPNQDVLEDYRDLIHEMDAYNPALTKKPRMVLLNKMDLYRPHHRDVHQLRKALQEAGLVSFPISALTGEGIEAVKEAIWEEWGDKIRRTDEADFEKIPLEGNKTSRGQDRQRRSHREERA